MIKMKNDQEWLDRTLEKLSAKLKARGFDHVLSARRKSADGTREEATRLVLHGPWDSRFWMLAAATMTAERECWKYWEKQKSKGSTNHE